MLGRAPGRPRGGSCRPAGRTAQGPPESAPAGPRHDVRGRNDLRVAIRRLLSTLRLMAAAVPRAPRKRARRKLRHLLRLLSRLRDTHVQLGLLRAVGQRRSVPKDVWEHLERGQLRLERRLTPTLAAVRIGRLSSLRHAVATATLTPRRTQRTEAALRAAHADALARLKARRRRMDPTRPETIHRLRLAPKRCRHMVEAMARLPPEADECRWAVMRECQPQLGGIQDLDMLLESVSKFAGSAPEPGRLEPLITQLRRRRDALLARFFAAAPIRHTEELD
ncbi:MAG: CHAD domain-containing protein [Limisphaerales bacterium]